MSAWPHVTTWKPLNGWCWRSISEFRRHFTSYKIRSEVRLLSTDHELIPARNASLAAMHGSVSGSNVRYYPTWKHSPFKGLLQCLNCRMFAVWIWITTSPYRFFVLPPHCTKDVYTPQGSTRDLWTVPFTMWNSRGSNTAHVPELLYWTQNNCESFVGRYK
jgi:hypothetical protein